MRGQFRLRLDIRSDAPQRWRGIRYLSPDFSVIAEDRISIVPAAAGPAFFILSLGIGIIITYASYLVEERNLTEDSAIIIGFDSVFQISELLRESMARSGFETTITERGFVYTIVGSKAMNS